MESKHSCWAGESAPLTTQSNHVIVEFVNTLCIIGVCAGTLVVGDWKEFSMSVTLRVLAQSSKTDRERKP